MGRERLALWAYTAPTASALGSPVARDYAAVIEELEFTTVAPGGFGDLSCVAKLADARIPRPELAPFARVCLRDGAYVAFAGDWSDPELTLDATGEYLRLAALGGGVALRDDPDESAYTSQTAQAIIAAEFAKRAVYLALDPDLSAVLPNAPGVTFSPVYDGANLEEILNDLLGALGDYVWTVYEHPRNLDALGFPTWQLRAHPRDVATPMYLALAQDVARWRVTPSSQRAYNVMQVAYVDPVSGPASVTVSDTRLGGGGTQGNAPFRRRKLRRNLGRLPLSSAQATSIANAWLASYANLTNKVEVELGALRDANGLPVPLYMARADGNLYLPELAPRGQRLSSSPTPGVNLFWIAETVYRESPEGARLTLRLENDADRAASLVARLQIEAEAQQRRRGVYRAVASPGAQQTGFLSIRLPNAAAGQVIGTGVSFSPTLANTPTGLTFSAISSANVGSGPSVTAGTLTPYGCEVTITAAGAGATLWTGKYTTVGA
jgi:hypothetical protein